ncbi:MAG: ATP-binding protein [Leptolyngbyaceae cyanobacterium]
MNKRRRYRHFLGSIRRLALPTKLVLIVSTIVLATTHFVDIDLFEQLADFLNKYESWELDEIFLWVICWLPALLVDYYIAVWRNLRESNQSLEDTNAKLAQANYAKGQLLAERQQAEAKLHQTNRELSRVTRLKDEFLASMSHEFRTPLNAILGITEGLQGGIYGALSSEQVSALQTVERSGFHLLELINDILDVARIESGQIQLNRGPTTIASLCKLSLSLVEQLAAKKNIQLELAMPSYLPEIWVDERRMRQVLLNLLNNAIKFTPEGGCVTLEARYREPVAAFQAPHEGFPGSLQIRVKDTGIGIAQHHIDKLFQPFVQIENALNRQSNGTGLGLALVKRIVDLHGGQIDVISQINLGSCFTIQIPYRMPNSSKTAAVPQHAKVSDSTPPKPLMSPLILLAEDDEASVKTVSIYLKAKGYRIVVAKTGQQAITLAQSDQPDIILMDIQMPEVDGLEAIQKLRCNSTLANVPIIAVTALAMAGDRERCLTAGANAYLSKPIKLQKLLALIQQISTADYQVR